MLNSDVSDKVKYLVNSSWADNTKASYNTYIKKWLVYCKEHSIEPYAAKFSQGAEFLAQLYEGNAKYGAIATARSALSAILPSYNGISFGKDPLVSRLIKGVFKRRPSLPKYTVIYDTNIVLCYMKSLPPNAQLLLEMLTKKLCMLLCLLSGQRGQTITYLNLDFMHKDDTSYTFYIPKVLKTTTINFHQEPLVFEAFPHDDTLCIIKCLEEYINRTALIRENACEGDKQLLLSFSYPHKPVKSATIARYIKMFLGMAGIDLTVFSAHSTRSAATIKANNLGLSIKDIKKAAGWKY